MEEYPTEQKKQIVVGKWRVEIPNLPDSELFSNQLERVLPTAEEEFHPILRRSTKNIQIVPNIVMEKRGKIARPWGYYTMSPKENVVNISISETALKKAAKASRNKDWITTAFGIILHECFEADIVERERDYGNESNKTSEVEEIATQKAKAHLEKISKAKINVFLGSLFLKQE